METSPGRSQGGPETGVAVYFCDPHSPWQLGREVRLGGGYADLLAAEPSGRLAIIEVKLAKSPEARRAVITQVLTMRRICGA